MENELTSPALLNDDALFYKFLKGMYFCVKNFIVYYKKKHRLARLKCRIKSVLQNNLEDEKILVHDYNMKNDQDTSAR